MRFEAMHAMMFFLPDTHREVLRLLLDWLHRISQEAHRHHVRKRCSCREHNEDADQ